MFNLGEKVRPPTELPRTYFKNANLTNYSEAV
jgi:hypothetical protein